ncbi:MAG: serpin family protein [Anaerolineae bacterium]
MKRRWFTDMSRLAMILAATGLIAGCASTTHGAVVQADKPHLTSDAQPSETAKQVDGNNAFAIDLYHALRQAGDGNLFYSPYSISIALAMTYAGARTETETEMASTLHYRLPQERLHPAFNALDTALTSQGSEEGEDAFQLNIANAIWGQEGFKFLPAFLDTLAENYGAGLRTLDFGQAESARQTINGWVSEQTKGKIEELVPKGYLDSLVRLVLTNAIYFNGKWVLPFEKDSTRDGPFTRLDGSEVSVPMMSQTARFDYTAGDGYQAIELPYRDSNMAMLFVLPKAGRFEEMEATLSSSSVDAIVEDFSAQQVHLTLPKFTFESEFDLSTTLAQMGMPSAFRPPGPDGADFSGMTGQRDLYISAVLHKAYVAVDEEGTEAAAATAVIMKLTSAMPDPLVQMTLDHPFLFLIRDRDSGTILFVGRVMDPS